LVRAYAAFERIVRRFGLTPESSIARVLAIAIACLVGRLIESRWDQGVELQAATRYVTLAAVSMLAHQWVYIWLAEWLFAFAWLFACPSLVDVLRGRISTEALAKKDGPTRKWVRAVAESLNRLANHTECSVLAILVVILATRTMAMRLLWLTLVFGFGIPILNGAVIATLEREQPSALPADPSRGMSWEQLRYRRRFLYVLTLGLIAVFVFVNPNQWREVACLSLVVLVAIAARFVATLWTVRGGDQLADASREEERLERAAYWDRRLLTVALAFILGLTATEALKSRKVEAKDVEHRVHAAIDLRDEAKVDAIDRPDAALFLVSDTQLHELRGARSGVHLELIDSIVPVAVRPIQLDLLSAATLEHFRYVYRRLAQLNKYRSVLQWAHLGDLGDLGCKTEINRALGYLERFEDDPRRRSLAGIAPGNHDSTFVGNFTWHPDWRDACTSTIAAWSDKEVGRSDKGWLNQRLHDVLRAEPPADSPNLLADTSTVHLIAHPLSNALEAVGLGPHKTALMTEATLAQEHDGHPPIAGIFFDTSDFTTQDIGLAGAEGSISTEQIELAQKIIARHDKARFVFFLHHTVAELSAVAKERFEALAKPLVERDRLLLVISAHTHVAAVRPMMIANKLIHEIVVGSTIDPPQEVALLEIGASRTNRYGARLRTIQAITRTSSTSVMPELAESAIVPCTCRRLLGDTLDVTGQTCPLPDHPLSEACKRAFRETERPGIRAKDPRQVKSEQQAPAAALLECLELATRPKPLDDPKLFDILDEAITQGTRLEAMVCLAWAASTEQGHKRSLWGFGHGWTFGFDRAAAHPPMDLFIELPEEHP
jgi:hypothetical protein